MFESIIKPELLTDNPMPLTQHLDELRRRLIISLSILLAGAVAVFNFTGPIITWLAKPVGKLVFISPLEAFHVRIEIALMGSLVATLPLLLHQAWLFVAPALSVAWRRVLRVLFPLSYILFMAGCALSLFVVLPLTVKFLTTFGTGNVRPMLALGAYLGFALKLSLAFGAVFQMPLALFGLNRAGILAKKTLAGYRKLVYLLCFVAGALLSPDMFAQFCIALPSIAMFEITLLFMS